MSLLTPSDDSDLREEESPQNPLTPEQHEYKSKIAITNSRLNHSMTLEQQIAEAEKLVQEGVLVKTGYSTSDNASYDIVTGLRTFTVLEVESYPQIEKTTAKLRTLDQNGHCVTFVCKDNNNVIEHSITATYHPNGFEQEVRDTWGDKTTITTYDDHGNILSKTKL